MADEKRDAMVLLMGVGNGIGMDLFLECGQWDRNGLIPGMWAMGREWTYSRYVGNGMATDIFLECGHCDGD